jgi:hypothetical protein
MIDQETISVRDPDVPRAPRWPVLFLACGAVVTLAWDGAIVWGLLLLRRS